MIMKYLHAFEIYLLKLLDIFVIKLFLYERKNNKYLNLRNKKNSNILFIC